MKIAILGTRGIPNNYGGYEQLAEYLSIGLVKRGHSVIVYNNSLHRYDGNYYCGVEIVKKYSPENIIGSAANIIYDYLCLRDAVRRRADIILECGYQSSSIGLAVLGRKKRQVILTHMDGLDWARSKWGKYTQKYTQYAEQLAVKYSDGLISDNHGITKYLRSKYNRDSYYAAYGAHIPTYYSKGHLTKYEIDEKKYYILIARLEPENNIETILDGFIQSKKEISFVVVGNINTAYGKYLTQKYHDNRIKFIGGVYDTAVINSLRYYSKIYFHGHSVGGTNPSLLEAMACECNIIAHDNEFNKYVLNDNAYYFKTPDEIANYLSGPEHIVFGSDWSTSNRISIEQIYSWSNTIDRYERIFNNALENHEKC